MSSEKKILIDFIERLEASYGRPNRQNREDPLDELILTILSQNTTDVNSLRAYHSLKERFPVWEDACEAGPEAIEELIRVGGLARTKSQNIHRILGELLRSERGLDLGYLSDLDDDAAMLELTSMKGVGSKTAACVLIFSLDKMVFPVDTHIHRIAKRWGSVPQKASREGTQVILNKLLPPDMRYHGHLLIIEHGRRTCKARKPLCGSCPLEDSCPRLGL
ncbi:MAG: endonuclease III [Thermoplasmata archaeon]|nr:endonuclease III [Thermoplasmata archaeon]